MDFFLSFFMYRFVPHIYVILSVIASVSFALHVVSSFFLSVVVSCLVGIVKPKTLVSRVDDEDGDAHDGEA